MRPRRHRSTAVLLALGLALGSAPGAAARTRPLGPTRPPGQAFALLVEIRAPGGRATLSPLPAGEPANLKAWLGPARAALDRLAGRLPDAGPCRAALELLADPEFSAEAARVAGLSPWSRGYLWLEPGSRRGRGLTTETRRLPHATAAGRDEPLRVVRASGRALAAVPDMPEALLHELAHLGEGAVGERVHAQYGRDGYHYLDEVLSPAAAFVEGWAEYQSTHLPPRWAGRDPISRALAVPASSLQLEQGNRRYRRIRATEACPALWLGNELTVAGGLRDLEAVAGREAVEAAFRAGAERPHRTLADLVGALATARPGLADAIRLALAERLHAPPSDPALDALAAGRLPAGMGAGERPGCRD